MGDSLKRAAARSCLPRDEVVVLCARVEMKLIATAVLTLPPLWVREVWVVEPKRSANWRIVIPTAGQRVRHLCWPMQKREQAL